MLKHESYLSFYKGWKVQILKSIANSIIFFLSYEKLKNMLQGMQEKEHWVFKMFMFNVCDIEWQSLLVYNNINFLFPLNFQLLHNQFFFLFFYNFPKQFLLFSL